MSDSDLPPAINPFAEARLGDELVAAGLRGWTPAKRLALACTLTAQVRSLARRAVARRHRDWSPEQCDIAFLGQVYGKELAEAFSRWRTT